MPPGPEWTTVLDLTPLRIEIRRGSGLAEVTLPWFQVRVHAASHPFRGTVESAWFAGNLHDLRMALTGLADTQDEVAFIVGGNRTAELRLTGGWTTTGRERWLRVRLTPSGDDPYPALEMLLYTEPANLVARLDELDAVLADLL